MNRHERRAAAKRTLVGNGPTVMHVKATPFPAPDERFSDMDRDTRRAYVAILYGMAEKLKARSRSDVPAWRTAASFHKLIQAGLVAIVRDGGRFEMIMPDDLEFNWVN